MDRAIALAAVVAWKFVACAPVPAAPAEATVPAAPAASGAPSPSAASAGPVNDPRCPAAPPQVKDGNDHPDCTVVDLACKWPSAPRCPWAKCAMSSIGHEPARPKWYVSLDMCAVDCPKDKPTAGAPCSPASNQVCHYAGGAMCGFDVRCTSNGWAEREVTLCGGM